MGEYFDGKDILVTGGSGSIGSRIVDKLLKFDVKRVRCFDNSEAGLFSLSRRYSGSKKLRLLVGDIRDEKRLLWAMEGVDVVFHAAALKHVPLCEYNPAEVVKTNILGTLNVINSAREKGVKKAILISTDKAVNPVNAMGASKLMAEKLFLNAEIGEVETKFSCVRFGNVLASNGSVLQVFKDQVAVGGPVTITSEKMSRFIMSMKEAVNLVLKVTSITEGREIYILKMKSLMIVDLAETLIEILAPLYGYRPEQIRMEVTGLRAGEKLHEQLLSEEEIKYTAEKEKYFVLKLDIVTPHESIKLPTGKTIDIRKYSSAAAPKLTKEQIKELIKEDLSFYTSNRDF
jgi:FlaA1/EpsC-like NDP-sugar epimerase